jgi:FxsC-like protein
VTNTVRSWERLGNRGSYFFLSYAHSPPLAGALGEDLPDAPDKWVRDFYDDLAAAVQARASRESGLVPGFYDQEIPIGSDWKATLSTALGTAEVFVPLYSPEYLSKSWPGREWACYEQRLTMAGIPNPLQRFAPVLWIPLPAGQEPRGLQEAKSLVPSSAGDDYRENGLRALLRLTPYRRSYDLVVDQLAEHIVQLAEKSPMEPSPVPDIDQVESAFNPAANAAVFAVVVAAPVRANAPAESESSAYGSTGNAWRPYGPEQKLSLADYARLLAEQLDFAVLITEIDKAGDMLSRMPGIILIDPWYLDGEERLNEFREFARGLPPWVLPIIIPTSGAERLTREAQVILAEARGSDPGFRDMRSSGSDPAHRALKGVSSLRDFVMLTPYVVTQAERVYLRHGGPAERPAARLGSRLRLVRTGGAGSRPAEEKFTNEFVPGDTEDTGPGEII